MSEPTPETASDEHKALSAELEAIRGGVADLTLAWSSLENSFVILFWNILGLARADIASEIYFTPTALELRMKIVDNAFKRLFHKNTEVSAAIIPKWQSLMNVLGRLRKTRNKVAHWSLITFSGHLGMFVRLAPPQLKNEDEAMRRYLMDGIKPGMGSNELRVSAHALAKARSRLYPFQEYVRLFNAGDTETLLRRLGEGEGEPQSQPPQGIQTPQEPPNQQPPSEE